MVDAHAADKVHPDKVLTYTASKTAGFRTQLITKSCHVLYAEIVLHTVGSSPAMLTAKLFTNDDPATAADDINVWNLTVPGTVGSSAWTPDEFRGQYFRNGVFAEVMSTDADAKVIVNVVYVPRDDYAPSYKHIQTFNIGKWQDVNGDDTYLEGFQREIDVDDYSDSSTSSTPDSGTGSSKGGQS